jgi:hypothetical protein
VSQNETLKHVAEVLAEEIRPGQDGGSAPAGAEASARANLADDQVAAVTEAMRLLFPGSSTPTPSGAAVALATAALERIATAAERIAAALEQTAATVARGVDQDPPGGRFG